MNLDEYAERLINLLPQNEIFVDKDIPRDYQNGLLYITELERLRSLTCSKALRRSLPCILDITKTWTHSLPDTSRRVLYQQYRPLLFSIDKLSTASPQDTTLTLEHVIRAKRDTTSQVYKGSLRIGSGKSREVCIKIYQQSMCSLPDIDSFDEDERYNPELRTARHDAGVEAWAYCKLAPLQGSIIPCSYGFYEARLPNGETAVVHILEYLNGVTLSSFKRRDDLERHLSCRVIDMVEKLLENIALMHELGVTHQDLNPNNIMLLTQPRGLEPLSSLAIIDFNRAAPVHAIFDNERGDSLCMLDLFRRYRVPIRLVEAWYTKHASSHPRPRWLSLFDSKTAGEGAHFRYWHIIMCGRERRQQYTSIEY
ncbi:hypothetical protein PUNSTDRAFT_55595 [Punctularia strigosozonata HHB-11173 SS5]|uniref:Protein kinase domain-containing protein n=1 Tax=Punctularia strigosozonata (strain HHB-11173) TaxID=741275 RepID=R7S3C3_PUNST|nr:uncharacterized protein PUNSTDRAFT_55595 [Punctularia strigosozonata HHB-11173 SS5]EIN04282.1 hypothetical protein PUNSTDRAFT_55595 [Punctularia strigosozonata HHB-11173 SS5]